MRIAFLVLLAPALGHAADPIRTTVYVSNDGAMDDRQLTIFERSLLYELGKREGIVPVAPPVVPAASDERCPERQASCLTQIALGLGADEVIAVHAVSMWDAKVLTVKRLHIQSGEITGSVTKQMTASDSEAYLMILGDVVDELYADRPLPGAISAGIPTAVIQRWNPPPLKPWAVWTGAGLTAATLTTGLVFGVLANDAEEEFNRLTHSTGEVSGAEVVRVQDKANSRALTANVFYGVAGVFAVSTVLVWLFSDWGSDEEALLELAAGGSTLSFTF